MTESTLLETEQAISELLTELGKLKKVNDQLLDAEKRSKEIITASERIVAAVEGILKNNISLRDDSAKAIGDAQIVISAIRKDLLSGQSSLKDEVSRLSRSSSALMLRFANLQEEFKKENGQFSVTLKMIEAKLEVNDHRLTKIEKSLSDQESILKTNQVENNLKFEGISESTKFIKEFTLGILVLAFILLGLVTAGLFLLYFRT